MPEVSGDDGVAQGTSHRAHLGLHRRFEPAEPGCAHEHEQIPVAADMLALVHTMVA